MSHVDAMEPDRKFGYSLYMLRLLPLTAILLTSFACGHPGGIRIPPIAWTGETTAPRAPSAQQLATSQSQQALSPERTILQTPTQESLRSQITPSNADVTAALVTINRLLDAYFDFNAYRLRPDAVESVSQAASILKTHMAADTSIRLVVEGHCDDRGSAEFNLALGDRRAENVRDLLSQLGIAANRMTTISYGEVRPECGNATETCWQKNRRAHIRHER